MAGINMQAAVDGPISAVNPDIFLTVQQSAGYTTGPDGKLTPQYITTTGVKGNVQSLQFRDLQMIDGLNLQGTRRKIYMQGEVDGVLRFEVKGGDLITTPDGAVWLVALVAEQWPQWCAAIVTLQDGS